ncbi:MAG: FMN-binding protein [Acutalibacteraceae bacterium]|jgi:Na+-translocating ferredoxin:NAD+ oxidoreductase RnfG subunit
MKSKLKSVLLAALTLTLIAGVTTAALAVTDYFTRDTIAARSEQIANEARRQVLTADAFEEATVALDGKDVTYHVGKKGGQTVGYVFSVTTSGKSAGLVIMTGVDITGQITGVAVTENSETAGYVDKVTKAGLLSGLVGKDSTDGVDTVSQATKTSKGVLHGVEDALAIYAAITGGGTHE